MDRKYKKLCKGRYLLAGYMFILHGGKVKLEHRVVMEQVIRRKLNRKEEVHHLDGDVLNNMPENLMLARSRGFHIENHNRGVTAESSIRSIQDIVSDF